ncbi:hypothetical protein GE061_018249 [Apolygus lucorum]|uniref:Uncharacterized protein n=1 Tax=Apolygus lucorum TaxID=248454 RepID=A0A8S9XFC8_APOLU|nr:hypothetical protein GE061_018249 [Apolygus lucorum]
MIIDSNLLFNNFFLDRDVTLTLLVQDKMNPPETAHPKVKRFCVTFEVTEGKTTGNVVSFEHVASSIVSSLSSGALADHSSLSESSESLPHLPAHSSTSTNSSGLNISRAAKRANKPCQCCSVLNYIKLHCLCGHGNLLFVRDISPKDGVEAKEGARHPEVYSDMDLTDPVIASLTDERASSSSDLPIPTEDTQDSQPFPRIRLSVRPECLVTNTTESQEDEVTGAAPRRWSLPRWEHLMASSDELPLGVPSHYKEDKRSRFLTLHWITRLLFAQDNNCPPPKGVTRVFHDPRTEPELPKNIYNLLEKFSDNEIVQILKRFDEVKHLAKQFAGGDCRNRGSSFDEEVHSTTGADGPQTCMPNIPSKIDEAAHVREQTAGDAVIDCKTTLVYAKFQKCVDDWDSSTRLITVHFYDGSPDKQFSPDMIFPLQRLPPGANIQLQIESNVYDDVFFMSFVLSMESNKPSATINILSEDSPVTSTTFPATALSPKDVVQIRSALKNAFYPRSRINFTELDTGSILGYASRRTRVAAASDGQKQKQVPAKRKVDGASKPSSSTEPAVSTPKRTKTEVTSTPLPQPTTAHLPPEPSSTEASYTSSEESPNVAYLCTAPGCGQLFDSESLLIAHRERIKKNRKRQHTTMQVVQRDTHKQSTSGIKKPTGKKVNFAGPSRPGGSRCVTIQLPQSRKNTASDSETDPGTPCMYGWSRCVQGFGLRPEKCILSDKVKSFKKLKGGSKDKFQPHTGLFSSQHFILTNGPPHVIVKSRKRALDSESESTDVENYYATNVVFDVLKLQEAIERGGGRVYPDFSDVPYDLRNNPGHNLIVVSREPTSTANYIYGVALGCTIIRHDTIFECIKKRMPLRDAITSGSAILLPPGWCEHKMTWAPPRASPVKPLQDLMFFLALRCNQETKSYWSALIRRLGGKPIVIESNHQLFARLDRSIYGIVADPEVATSLSSQAIERGVPIVNTAWVIQAVISGSQPPFSSYRVTVRTNPSRMSSDSDTDVEDVPRKRRKGAEKENLSPSPESQGRHERKRTQASSRTNSKKARVEHSQKERLSQPVPSVSSASNSGISPGKIVRVQLINFMCHNNLVFTFGDKVNFISGKNGSGKSAILTALVLGLGGRTSDTNRGSSLANLIKNGETRGSIEITISNTGVRSHYPDKYGNEITVVRNISDRSSTYKLLSDKGKVVSNKRMELNSVLMSFNIQVNNPVSILNQDLARTFLKTATPKELYNLFRKGTLIDEIEEKLSELQTRKLPQIRSLLKRKELANSSSVNDLLEYKKKVEKYAELTKAQDEVYNLQRALSWVYVSDLEEILATTEGDLTQVVNKIEQMRQSIESREGTEQHLKEKLGSLEVNLQMANAESEVLDQANVDLEQKVAYYKGIVKRKIVDIKKLQNKIESEGERCTEIQSEIDNQQSRIAEIESKTAKILQQKTELRKRSNDLKAVVSTTEFHKQQLADTVDKISKDVTRTEQFTANLYRSITQKQEYLKSLKGEKNELRVYSEWMSQLVAEIERMNERKAFDSKPRGPFGRFIKLKEESWGPVVESFIGNSLKSFAVCSSKDLTTMRKIFDKLNIPKEQRPTVTVTKFQDTAYDCSSTEVRHPKYKNLFRSIEVSDATVANVLLDMYQPDTVLLVPTSAETYPLAQDQASVPPNCAMFLNKDGTRIYPEPAYRCYSNRVAEKTRFLQVSPEQAIRITEHELKSLKEDYVTQKKTMEDEKKKLVDAQQKLKVSLKELDTLMRQLNNCETKLFEAEQVELPESFDLNILEEDLQYRKNVIETIKAQTEVMEKEKNEAMDACKLEKAAWTEKEKIKEELSNKIKGIEKELLDVKGQLRKYNTNHNHIKEALKMEMVKKERYSEKIQNLKKELEEALKTATELCSERVIEPQGSKQELEKRMNELSHSVKVLEKIVGKKPIKPADYENRVEKYKQTTDSLKKVSEAMNALKGNYEILVKQMDSVLNLVCSNTVHSFKKILAMRSFVGEININHESKTLSLNVKSDPNVTANTVITTLSGGERSYSMVAFIMSLWENMATPFYFLDEFDVFMDEVNRNLIMDLLMAHARRNPDKQFVFLTPHAVRDESSQDVHFFRMEDPRR